MTAHALGMNRVTVAVLHELAQRGGHATAAELAQHIGVGKDTVLTRLELLAEAEIVTPDRPGGRGRPAIVWTLHPQALADALTTLLHACTPPETD